MNRTKIEKWGDGGREGGAVSWWSFDLLNSMIYDLKRSVDLRWLFDPVLHSSLGKGGCTKPDEFSEKSISLRGGSSPNRMNFWKTAKGGQGVIFNPKIYVADLGNFKQGFLSMKLIKIRGFRVCFFNNCIDISIISIWQRPFGIFPKNHPIW